jgi:competence protein ComEC
MFTFWMLGDTGNRNVNIYNTLSASALLLLLLNPQTLFDVGFQLSYMAVLGIVVFYQDIYRWLLFRNVILKYIWSMIAVSLAAQLLTLPLTLYYFHQFPNYFLLSNIIALPLSTVILYGSILALLLAPFPFLWGILGGLLRVSVDGMNKMLIWIEHLPHSVTTGITIPGIMAVLLFLSIAALRIFLFRRKASYLVWMLMCLIVSYASIWIRKMNTLRSDEVVVYNAPIPFLVQLRSGFHNYLLTGSHELTTEKPIQPYNLHHYLTDCLRIFPDSSTILKTGDLMIYKNFIFFSGKKIYFWQKRPDFHKQTEIDILIISRMTYRDMPVLGKYFRPKHVVVTSGVFGGVAFKLKEYFCRENIPCNVVKTDGAWVLSHIKKIDE